jgi:hypothetical protein
LGKGDISAEKVVLGEKRRNPAENMNPGSTTEIEKILDGMEAALELERELGVRVVECDRMLLTPIGKQEAALPHSQAPSAASPVSLAAAPASISAAPASAVPPAFSPGDSSGGAAPKTARYDFVFLHHCPLSAAGAEMMEKIIGAMKKNAATAPIVVESPLPPAKVYVVLGSFALKKFFPSLRGAPGQWLKSESGSDVLVSNSPEYILRFGVETAAVRKIKQDMWRSLKTVEQRLASL